VPLQAAVPPLVPAEGLPRPLPPRQLPQAAPRPGAVRRPAHPQPADRPRRRQAPAGRARLPLLAAPPARRRRADVRAPALLQSHGQRGRARQDLPHGPHLPQSEWSQVRTQNSEFGIVYFKLFGL